MINLGPYSGKKCPNVRFQPTVLDRILEGTALLIVLVTWISILIVLLPFILLFHLWGIERSGFFNGREKWAKGFENQRV